MKKTRASARIFEAILLLIAASMLALVFSVHPVKADGGIQINADGSINPSTAPISTADNITYTLTNNIANESITVQRNGIVLNGAGYTIEGSGSEDGIDLSGTNNVTIENMNITGCWYGIYLNSSSNITVTGNNITASSQPGIFLESSSNSILLSNNNLTDNLDGMYVSQSFNVTISENTIAGNSQTGIYLDQSSNCAVVENNVSGSLSGIYLNSSSSNIIFHNRFFSNSENANCTSDSTNTWDNGYPSGGNYWSDYQAMYPNATEIDSSGIWNTPYVIDANNTDNYPLVSYNVTFVTFYVSGVNSDFTGTVITIDGANYTFSNFPLSFSWDSSSAHNFSYASPLSASAGKQYVWNSTTGFSDLQADSITVTESGSVTGDYLGQYYLTIISAHGSPSPSSGWFDSESSINESVTSPASAGSGVQYVCTGWSATGSITASGSGSSVTFTISAPSAITWNWKTQYQLTVSSAYSSTTGTGWYDNGSTADATLADQIVPGSSGTRYFFIGWTGDASGSALTSSSITMDGPKTTVADWGTQYYLNVTSTFGTCSGSGWYNNGSTAYASLTNGSVTEANGLQYVFTGWSSDASGTYYDLSNGITMNGSKTATADWTLVQFALTVELPSGSVGGSTRPSAGVFVQNDTSPIKVTAIPDAGYTFDHWVLDGQNVANNPITVPMTTAHTLIPVFQPLNFTLTILPSNGGTTSPTAETYTYSYGTNVTITASPRAGYNFDHWLQDGVTVTSNPVTVTIDGNTTLQPFYQMISPPYSQLTMYLYFLVGLVVGGIAVFVLIVFIERRRARDIL